MFTSSINTFLWSKSHNIYQNHILYSINIQNSLELHLFTNIYPLCPWESSSSPHQTWETRPHSTDPGLSLHHPSSGLKWFFSPRGTILLDKFYLIAYVSDDCGERRLLRHADDFVWLVDLWSQYHLECYFLLWHYWWQLRFAIWFRTYFIWPIINVKRFG